MGILRNALLMGSQSTWLRERAPRYRFVRTTVSRFMPGEQVDDALTAARALQGQRLPTIFTRLGENITEWAEADAVTRHYLDVLDRVKAADLDTEISIKLTQLGLDLSRDRCQANVEALVKRAGELKNFVWIDMEGTAYTDVTLDIYRRLRAAYRNVGVCLQAYLRRTAADLASLLPLGSAIRLVKGAYKEPPELAFPRKKDVDASFYALAQNLLGPEAQRAGVRAAFGTHDRQLIQQIVEFGLSRGLAKDRLEFQMLYGIQRGEQLRLAREGYHSRVLVAYGEYWFPWFMRRLAERPANVLFVARNLLGG